MHSMNHKVSNRIPNRFQKKYQFRRRHNYFLKSITNKFYVLRNFFKKSNFLVYLVWKLKSIKNNSNMYNILWVGTYFILVQL